MKIEICILNPCPSKKSNDKLKKTALEVISQNSRIFINENLIEDYFNYHHETTSISDLIKSVENNHNSDAFILASYEDIGVETIRKITSKPILV